MRAAQRLSELVSAGDITSSDISEELFSQHLYTYDLPDPELIVRTSGELRVSNYLLWQIAYSEFYISQLFWPDFDRWELLRAIRSFQRRDRRFGGAEAE